MSHRVYWHRQDNDQDAHPDILEVGPRAAIVFRLLCRIAGKAERRGNSDGFIPSKATTPRHMKRIIGTIEGVEDIEGWIRAGLETLLAYDPPLDEGDRLIEKVDGGLRILAWQEKKADPTAAERKRRQRDTESQEVTDPVTVTPGDSRDGPVSACVTPEERRGEESTGEDLDPPKGPQRGRLPPGAEEEILQAFRETTGRPFRVLPRGVVTRFRDGATVEDVRMVLRWLWATRAGGEFAKFVTPETVFRKSKWDTYRAQAEFAEETAKKHREEPEASWSPRHPPLCQENSKDWIEILGAVKPRLNDHVFATYFGCLRGFCDLDGIRILEASNPFLRDWVADNYLEFIQDRHTDVLGCEAKIEIRTIGSTPPANDHQPKGTTDG